MKVGEIVFLVLAMKSFEALSGETKRVGYCNTDPSSAHV
jgi:hypothetical protein